MILNVQMFIRKDVLDVRLDGELDQSTVEELKERVVELIEKYNIRYLVLNFRQLSFMDSSGIGFIIGRYNRLRQENGFIILCDMNEAIERIVNLSGLNKICLIKKNEEDVKRFLEVCDE